MNEEEYKESQDLLNESEQLQDSEFRRGVLPIERVNLDDIRKQKAKQKAASKESTWQIILRDMKEKPLTWVIMALMLIVSLCTAGLLIYNMIVLGLPFTEALTELGNFVRL